MRIINQKSFKTKGIQSFERAIYILDEIKSTSAPLTLTEISNKTSISKSSLQKYLVSFLKLNILHYDEGTKTYDFDSKLIELGLNALNRIDVISIIDPYLLKIREEFTQASILALWTKEGPMIAKYQSSGRSINVEIKVGFNPSLLGSSVGKCFAAFLPKYVTEELCNKEITMYDLNVSAVMEELNFIRKHGFASRDTEFDDLPGSRTIAAPIFDYSGKVIAVLGLLGFTKNLSTDPNSREVIRLKEIAKQISNQLAYSKGGG